MQTKAVVTDTHFFGRETDVLQAGIVFGHQREVAFNHSGFLFRTDYLIGCQSAELHKTRIVHYPLELLCGFKELGRRILVYLLRNDMPPAQRTEVALHTATFLCRLGQKEVAGMLQVWSFVEMSFKGAAEETHVLLVEFGFVALTDIPVLLVDDGEVREHLDCLYPAAVYRLIFRTRDSV